MRKRELQETLTKTLRDAQTRAQRAEQTTLNREDQLIKLGLIPERFQRHPHPEEGYYFYWTDLPKKVINWRAIKQEIQDLEAYRTAERGRKIAEKLDPHDD